MHTGDRGMCFHETSRHSSVSMHVVLSSLLKILLLLKFEITTTNCFRETVNTHAFHVYERWIANITVCMAVNILLLTNLALNCYSWQAWCVMASLFHLHVVWPITHESWLEIKHCVIRPCYHIQSTSAQNFHKGGAHTCSKDAWKPDKSTQHIYEYHP